MVSIDSNLRSDKEKKEIKRAEKKLYDNRAKYTEVVASVAGGLSAAPWGVAKTAPRARTGSCSTVVTMAHQTEVLRHLTKLVGVLSHRDARCK